MNYQHRRYLLIFIGVLLLNCTLTGIYLYISALPAFNQNQLVRAYPTETKRNAPRTILHWNTFFGNKTWNLPGDTLGPSFFRLDLNCHVFNCEVTSDRNFLPSVDMFDAILFHVSHPFSFMYAVPSERKSNQLYVFATMEGPGATRHDLSNERNFYNMTMTYRLDSDILWVYNNIKDIESGKYVAPAKSPAWRQPPTKWNDTTIWKLWPGKTKTAAWFVSNCRTMSRREKLVEALQDLIDVDVYGKCGTMSCHEFSGKCDNMLDEEYKFYFSFENALCIDYVTEKAYNALQRNLIPVVFGGADYTRFLPPHSYIDVQNYKNIEDLALYLKYLAANPEEYMRYFWWRRYYRVESYSVYCDLCEKLHNANYQEKRQSYQNIEKWWMSGQCEFEAKIKY